MLGVFIKMQEKLIHTKQWNKLQLHYETKMSKVHLRDLFKDNNRFNKYSINFDKLGILFDYSKNIIDDETKSLILVSFLLRKRLHDVIF